MTEGRHLKQAGEGLNYEGLLQPSTRLHFRQCAGSVHSCCLRTARKHYKCPCDGIVAVMDAIKAGLGVGIVPVFMLEGEPALVPLGGTLADCESDLWLLAHPESRHLRRISAVYDHFAASITLA